MLFKIRMEGYSNLFFCFLCLNGVCLLIKERFEGSRRNKGVRFRSGIWQLRVQDSNVKLLIEFNWFQLVGLWRRTPCMFASSCHLSACCRCRPADSFRSSASDQSHTVRAEGSARGKVAVPHLRKLLCWNAMQIWCKCVCQLCRILRSFRVFLLTYGYIFCVQALN